MARCLIIGCGCRGVALARELRARGNAVRGTTRRPERVSALEDAGVEPVLGDPDRVASIAPALEHVSAVCVLLGSATGSRASLAALHGSRLDMLLTRMLDTTVRGIVFEATGTVPEDVLEGATARVREACEGSRIPYELLDADPHDVATWTESAAAAVERVLRGS